MRLSLLITITSVLVCLAGCSNKSDSHWGYQGDEGPQNWGELHENYAQCALGKNQSPVNIEKIVPARLAPIKLDYLLPAYEILNNGHALQLAFLDGNSFTLEGEQFDLKQIHFHTPSENTVKGEHFPLEAHFVHANKEGRLAVIGVFFKEGRANPALKLLTHKLPMQKGEKEKVSGTIYPRNMMPHCLSYYRVSGSLTTPPCSEGVIWLMLKQPIFASKEQIKQLNKAIGHDNNRPVQPLNSRLIVN